MKLLIGDSILTPDGMSVITDIWIDTEHGGDVYQTENGCLVPEDHVDIMTSVLNSDELL